MEVVTAQAGVPAALGNAPLAASHQIKIISSNPVTTGIFSYGRATGILASIGIIVLLVLVPLLYCFYHVYDRFKTHSVEFESIRNDFAKNRLESLQRVLPKFFIPRDPSRIAQEEQRYLLEHYDSKTLSQAFKQVIPMVQKGQWKEVLTSGAPELAKKIAVLDDDIYLGLKQARETLTPQLAKQIALVTVAQLSIETAQEKQRLESCQEVAAISPEVVDYLAQKGMGRRRLDLFLLKEKTFGEDPQSKRFQAGLALVTHRIGEFRDQAFIGHILKITQAIKSSPDDNLEMHLQKEVRVRLDELSRSPLYQKLQRYEGRRNPYVRLVQDLTLAIRLNSNGIEHFRALGKKYYQPMREKVKACVGSLAEALDTAIGKYHWSYKIETLFDKLLVFSRYPDKTQMAYLSHQPETALDYNSYQVGNHDLAYGDYGLRQKKMRAIFGPTPTGDLLLRTQLEWMREVGGIHLQHNLEHPGFSRGDKERIRYLLGIEQEFPQTFRLFSTPLDGTAWKLRGRAGQYFTDFQTTQEFYLKYGTYAFANRTENPADSFDTLQGNAHRVMEGKGDNGFYFGKDVLSDEQIRQAFAHASQAFDYVIPQNENKKRLSRALQVGVQGFIAVGALIKAIQDSPENREELLNASFGQACKLDIDRGVVLNVMTRVYFELAAGNPIDEEIVSEIMGTVIGRAELVSGRTIISDRYQPLSDALRLLGKNPDQVQHHLRAFLKEGFGVQPEELSFQSSS
ncbi:MAG: hypothetical protein KDK64_06525 [Chlamydiia bacterium]|nr:hypothetical protein [Chlamydiia bacterium]